MRDFQKVALSQLSKAVWAASQLAIQSIQNKNKFIEKTSFFKNSNDNSFKEMEETEEDLNYLGTSTEFQCSSCPSSFSAIEDLISHCDSIHGSEEILELPTPPEEPPKNEKKLRCDLCSATFSKQSGLEFHLRKSHTFCSSSIFVPSKPKDDEIHQIGN